MKRAEEEAEGLRDLVNMTGAGSDRATPLRANVSASGGLSSMTRMTSNATTTTTRESGSAAAMAAAMAMASRRTPSEGGRPPRGVDDVDDVDDVDADVGHMRRALATATQPMVARIAALEEERQAWLLASAQLRAQGEAHRQVRRGEGEGWR